MTEMRRIDSIVSRDTMEQDFALKRQLLLCEQGHEYRIVTLDRPEAWLPAEALAG